MAVRLWKMTYADGDIMFRRNKPNPRGIMKHTLTEGIFLPTADYEALVAERDKLREGVRDCTASCAMSCCPRNNTKESAISFTPALLTPTTKE
jgi:hypothetical protein